MSLAPIDWAFVIGFFVISLGIGLFASKFAGKNAAEFFLSGRNMPWWMLGISMVATTFAADTPTLVTDIVRQNGVAGNWVWWAFLLTGMLTVFVYAKLWRRSGMMTDIEFYELRYSGKSAAFLRGFRALYLGVLFNIIIMATVTLAAIKIAGVLLNLSPTQTVIIAATVTVAYSMLGGLRGVILTDLIQFVIAFGGAVAAAVVAVQHADVAGLSALFNHPQVAGKLNFIPDFNNKDLLVSVFILPLAVQWWSVWYPGAEPGGGGYIVQRMLSAKSEKDAMGATLLFNAAHYALRPWPWIIVALASLVVFPDLNSLATAFPDLGARVIGHDLAYPAMLTFLPAGLLGLVVASLIAAYMSTISTHLNWGSSYVVNDFYQRFVNPDATEKQQVTVGRISTLILMILAGALAPWLENAKNAFDLILQVGAGTGLLFILRWFWWRINAWTEITAMVVSFLVAVYFTFIHEALGFGPLEQWQRLISGVGITTLVWMLVAFFTKPADDKTLFDFYRTVQPGGPGWKPIRERAHKQGLTFGDEEEPWDVPFGILCMVFGTLAIYATLFGTGSYIYGNIRSAVVLTIVAVFSATILIRLWPRLKFK